MRSRWLDRDGIYEMALLLPSFLGDRRDIIRRVPLWWAHPCLLVLFVIIPVYGLCCLFADQSLSELGIPSNFITLEKGINGFLSLFVFACGSLAGAMFKTGGRPIDTISPVKLDHAILFTFLLSSVAYTVFFLPILSNLDALSQFLAGSSDVRFRRIFNQWPGVTSFMMAGNIALALFTARCLFHRRPVSQTLVFFFYATILASLIRAFLNSERLALIEAAFAISIAPAFFSGRRRVLKQYIPFIAIGGVFVLFSFFEYFRSWQFYKEHNTGGFGEFALVRFLGYYVTSINNGAGMLEHVGALGYPALSGAWFYKFPLFSLLGVDVNRPSPVSWFLQKYADPEFNNPGGMFVLLIDYGVGMGLVAMFVYGIVAGILYRSFAKGSLTGLILYPSWLAGISDLLRILYWAETRMFSVVLTAAILVIWLRGSRSWRPSSEGRALMRPPAAVGRTDHGLPPSTS